MTIVWHYFQNVSASAKPSWKRRKAVLKRSLFLVFISFLSGYLVHKVCLQILGDTGSESCPCCSRTCLRFDMDFAYTRRHLQQKRKRAFSVCLSELWQNAEKAYFFLTLVPRRLYHTLITQRSREACWTQAFKSAMSVHATSSVFTWAVWRTLINIYR